MSTTRSAGRYFGSGRGRLAAALLLAAALCARPALLLTQEEEDIGGVIEKYRSVLTLANQKLEDLDLPEALARFTEVIDAYKAGKLPSTTPLTRQIVGQAYEARARTYANLGRNAEAEADFEALIRFDVAWPVDRTRTSPKIIALYDSARKRIVGTLAVSSEPPGARISLNGEPVGRTPLFDRELTAGPYTLRVEADGFDPVQVEVLIAGGGREEKTVRLTPNARNLLVATSPPGVKVSLDGRERGVTFGSAGPEYAEVAAKLGVGVADISAPLLVEHVPPGDHLLKIEKECHEPQLLSITVAVDPNNNPPLRYEPIKLTPSLGGLNVESDPAGSEVILDGKPIGRSPLKLDGICTGRHEMTLRAPDVGQWIGTVEILRGQRASVSQRPRMTLAYVGMTEAGPGGQPPPGEQELGEALSRLTAWNVIRPGAGLPDALLARRRTGGGPDLAAGYLASVAEATRADLILAARPGEGAFERRVEVIAYPGRESLASLRDVVQLSLDEAAQLKDLVARLDARARLSAPWLGLSVIEVHGAPNPIVIRVEPGSPAAKAGVRLAEAVVSLGGKPVARGRDLQAALRGLREGSQASLVLQPPGAAPRQINVVIGSTPLMAPPDDPRQLVTKLVAEMAFRARLEAALGRPRSEERGAALLSLGYTLMRRGLYTAALREALEQAQMPEGAGLSAGTISYLRGMALLRLNRLTDARQQLAHAAGQGEATLWSHDGPPVAERARRHLAAL